MTQTEREPHPDLPGQLVGQDELVMDEPLRWPVLQKRTVYDGGFISVTEEDVEAPDDATLSRTVVHHQGAVAVVAVDDDGRVLMLEQYRHAVGHRLLELPAGILDVAGESAAEAAARELGEEADLRAERWQPLVETFSSPGFTDERVATFLARGLSAVPEDQRTARGQEEAEMTSVWLALPDAVTAALDGRVHNALAVIGILAASAHLAREHADTA